jgi:5-methylcytosine-specific restriction endonuclease McrA
VKKIKATPKYLRHKRICAKTNNRCAHCGKKLNKLNWTVDHYIPKSKGGTYADNNLMPLCKECNRSRGDRSINPREYYKFASNYEINRLKRYERENKYLLRFN